MEDDEEKRFDLPLFYGEGMLALEYLHRIYARGERKWKD